MRRKNLREKLELYNANFGPLSLRRQIFNKTTDDDNDIQISNESNDLMWFEEVSALPPNSGINLSRMFEK
ncbi:MAG: hypothetical protein LBB21_01360 [Holosporaceae bacterium]|jgi:hypothetical protein|nr:hypothetical protein [Holosporaceae bacterium]